MLDHTVATLADRFDSIIGLITDLAEPGADIRSADRTDLRPIPRRRPDSQRTLWAVGYTKQDPHNAAAETEASEQKTAEAGDSDGTVHDGCST